MISYSVDYMYIIREVDHISFCIESFLLQYSKYIPRHGYMHTCYWNSEDLSLLLDLHAYMTLMFAFLLETQEFWEKNEGRIKLEIQETYDR